MKLAQKSIKPVALFLFTAFAQYTQASGYHFGTQSVTSQGTANAAAAEAADATTIFYNPAGLTQLPSHEITGAVNLVAPHIRYRDAQAAHLSSSPVQGSNEGKITPNAVFAPHVYGAYKINDRFTLGVGVYVPFASSTEYDRDSVLRYNMNQLGLTTIAAEPVLAFKANDQHSFGVGVIAQHSTAKLRKFADWGSALKQAGKMDGVAEVKGKDWGVGYHLAWLYNINNKARVGINYRSHIVHNLKGTAKWSLADEKGMVALPNPATGVLMPVTTAQAYAAAGLGKTIAEGGRGFVPSEDASVKIITPESLSVHGMFKATDKLDVFGDITWTRHSRFKNAELTFANAKAIGVGKTANKTVVTPNWRDTIKVAVGGAYQITEPLQLRAGIAFDQSPVRNATYRMNTLPDGNRIWWSAGVKYTHNKKHVFDVAYSHIHINDTKVNTPAATGNDVDSKGPSSAKFKNYANILGAQYSYRF